jgi:DNA-directed RNA polymerase specialized sigma24 family protein
LQALVRRAADGDRRAWDRLVDKYARLIWHITREFNLVESDATDVAQTTWLRLLEHIDRLDPDRLGSWLAATAKQECRLKLAATRTSPIGCLPIPRPPGPPSCYLTAAADGFGRIPRLPEAQQPAR